MKKKKNSIHVPRLWRLEHWKLHIAHRQWRSNSPRRGRKPYIRKRKTYSHIFSGFGNGFSRGWQRNRHLEDLPQTDFCRLPEILLLSERTKSINEFYKLKITLIVVFVITIQRMFPSWALAPTHCTIVHSFIVIH